MKKTLAALGCLALSASFTPAAQASDSQFEFLSVCGAEYGSKTPNRQLVLAHKVHLGKRRPTRVIVLRDKHRTLLEQMKVEFRQSVNESLAAIAEDLHGTTDFSDNLRERAEKIAERYSAIPGLYASIVIYYDALPREGCALPDGYNYEDFKKEHNAYAASAQAIEAQNRVDTRDSYMNVCNASKKNQTITKYKISFTADAPETARTAFHDAMVNALKLETNAIHEAYMPHTERGKLEGRDASLFIHYFKSQIIRHATALQKQYNVSVEVDVDVPAIAAGCGLNIRNMKPAQNYRQARSILMYAGQPDSFIPTPVTSLDDLFSRLKVQPQ